MQYVYDHSFSLWPGPLGQADFGLGRVLVCPIKPVLIAFVRLNEQSGVRSTIKTTGYTCRKRAEPEERDNGGLSVSCLAATVANP